MSYQLGDKYKFEAGDIVEIDNELHPFNGDIGVVSSATSTEQCRIRTKNQEIDCWVNDLKLLSTHRTKIPDAFLKD